MDTAVLSGPKIEVGVRYKRRDGSVTPPLVQADYMPWAHDPETGYDYDKTDPNGHKVWGEGDDHDHDLVSVHRASLKN